MIEAFNMNDAYILKTLPLICLRHGGEETRMFYVNQRPRKKNCTNIRNKAQKIWGEKIDRIYCPIALAYTAVYMPDICIDFLTFMRNQNCEIFVGNGAIPHETIRLLFGDCRIVSTPSRSAYKEIDTIEQECLKKISEKSDEYRVAIISCGNTGRVLIKRLWPKLENVFFFDFGSLMDAICGWKARNWIRKENFNSKDFVAELIKRSS